MTKAKLLRCLKWNKSSELSTLVRTERGLLRDVQVTTVCSSPSCSLGEMEGHISSLSLSKGPRRKRQSLQLSSACSGSQPLLHPQHSYNPPSSSNVAREPLQQLVTRTFHTPEPPAWGALIQPLVESTSLSLETPSLHICTDHNGFAAAPSGSFA